MELTEREKRLLAAAEAHRWRKALATVVAVGCGCVGLIRVLDFALSLRHNELQAWTDLKIGLPFIILSLLFYVSQREREAAFSLIRKLKQQTSKVGE
jgi:hypothetical protein